jgi:hypothetical protein
MYGKKKINKYSYSYSYSSHAGTIGSIRQYFQEAPIIWESAYIFMKRHYFGIPPEFS